MARLIYRVRRRLHRPTHIDRFGNYRDLWIPSWEPDLRGEIR